MSDKTAFFTLYRNRAFISTDAYQIWSYAEAMIYAEYCVHIKALNLEDDHLNVCHPIRSLIYT